MKKKKKSGSKRLINQKVRSHSAKSDYEERAIAKYYKPRNA